MPNTPSSTASPRITGISSMATRQVLADMTALFESSSGMAVAIESVGGVDAAKRVQAGEAFDIVILAADAIDKLVASGHIHAGSRADLVLSGVSVAVGVGAALPDISSEDAVRQAVLNASSVSYSTGPSGVALVKLFERWGIADSIKNKLVQAPPGVPVGSLVAKGEVSLGFQQLSELLNVKGIQIVGPLPPAIQINTIFSVGVSASVVKDSAQAAHVKTLLDFLTSPQTAETKIRQGMMPI